MNHFNATEKFFQLGNSLGYEIMESIYSKVSVYDWLQTGQPSKGHTCLSYSVWLKSNLYNPLATIQHWLFFRCVHPITQMTEFEGL